jgi:hypothetical protein
MLWLDYVGLVEVAEETGLLLFWHPKRIQWFQVRASDIVRVLGPGRWDYPTGGITRDWLIGSGSSGSNCCCPFIA